MSVSPVSPCPGKPGLLAGESFRAAPAPKRVLIYSSARKSDRGGVQNVINGLAAALRGAGDEVTVAWPDGEDGPGEWCFPLSSDFHAGPAAVPDSARAVSGLARLYRRLHRWKPDVVNLHFLRGDAVYFALLKPLFGYRLVLSLHGSDYLYATSAFRKALPRLIAAADEVTVVSEALKQRMIADGVAGASSARVIRNGIDTGFWKPRPVGLLNAPMRFVAAGRCVPVKGFDLLLRAFARFSREEAATDAELVIAGDGEERAALVGMAEALGIGGRVAFPGHCGPEELRDWYHEGSVFVLSSRSEGLPLALIEAMASGLPPVATDVGGVREVIGEDTGVLVPAEDEAALARAFARVATDRHYRAGLARRALERSSEFSASRCHRHYADLLEVA